MNSNESWNMAHASTLLVEVIKDLWSQGQDTQKYITHWNEVRIDV